MTTEIRRRPGRPRALDDPEVRRRIIAMVRAGMWPGRAAQAAGISRSTLKHWRARVKAGDPEAARYRRFFGQLIKAEALSELDAVRKIRKGGRGWKAAAFFLERRFPKRWGAWRSFSRPDRGVKAPGDLSKLSDEELDRMAKELRSVADQARADGRRSGITTPRRLRRN